MFEARTTARVASVLSLDGRDETALIALATAGGRQVVVGDDAFMRRAGISLERLGDWPNRLRRRGEEVLFIAVDGRIAGVLGVVMEEKMSDLLTADQFPSWTVGLPEAVTTSVVEVANVERIDLRIAPVAKRLGDQVVRMLAYNGSVPGTTLRVPQGAEIDVRVINEGDLETTVHWHGLRLDNRYDGTMATQSPIPVGGEFTYRLSFPDPGVYWYHPHIREDYGQELGLYGNIIVEPAAADYWPLAHRELVLTIDDIRLEEGTIAPFSRLNPTYSAMGRFGNVMLVNGEPQPEFTALPGEVVRFFLTNTANTRVFNLAIPGARMKLVGGDSGRVEHESFVEELLIAPSERLVVDVLFGRAGELALEHRTPDRTYALATITVAGKKAHPTLDAEFECLRADAELAKTRAVVEAFRDTTPDRILALVAEMDLGAGDDPAGGYVCPMHPEVKSDRPDKCPRCGMTLLPAAIVGTAPQHHGDHHHQEDAAPKATAGIEWEDDMLEVNRQTTPANTRWKLIDRATGAEGMAIDWRFRVGDKVKIRLVNEMHSDHPMPHPFHIHGAGRFVVLGRNGTADANLAWKDTVLVRTGETVDILLDVTHPGVWMAHCHIAEHHESGMMLRFLVEPNAAEAARA